MLTFIPVTRIIVSDTQTIYGENKETIHTLGLKQQILLYRIFFYLKYHYAIKTFFFFLIYLSYLFMKLQAGSQALQPHELPSMHN